MTAAGSRMHSGPRLDIGEIAAELRADARPLAESLLPAGRLDASRREWCAGSLAGDAGQSLRVCLRGPKKGLWYEHAAGEGGDMLDLVARVHFNGHRGKALGWAARWLCLDDSPPHAAPRAAKGPKRRGERPTRGPYPGPADLAKQEAEAEAWRENSRKWARGAWFRATPTIWGTAAEAYLAGRGIDFELLGRQPAALRFHPSLTTEGKQWPAMVACIVDTAGGRGEIAGKHRTFLARGDQGRWTKAPMDCAKKVLGQQRGGLIPIWRERSNKPLRQAPPDDVVVLTEGIEDALTVALAWREARVICCLNVANIGAVTLPPQLRDVVIYADNDAEGSDAAKKLMRVGHTLLGQGRRVRIARMPQAKDVNAHFLSEVEQ